jgi:hypothetical protein
MAGYSGTPLARKLGIIENDRVVTIGAPDDYDRMLAPVPDGVRFSTRIGTDPRFVHVFTRSREQLEQRLVALRQQILDDGMVWISWPKKSSGVGTDVTEDVIRELALPLGFVDVKVCAVDETWSGLKLVIRREHRGHVATPRRKTTKR